MTFEERCKVCEQCLPESPFRGQVEKLHNEMLAKIAELENRLKQKAVIGQYKIASDGEKEGTIVGSANWLQYVQDAGLTDQWLELAFIPVTPNVEVSGAAAGVEYE